MIYNDTGLPLIRKAKVDDIEIVHRILNRYAQQGLLLPRSLSELYEHLREYFVLETDPSSEVRGVCGLGICWKDLAEIESLAVCEADQGKGFGLRLVEECLHEARSLGIKKVFTLTYVPDFFVKMGFEEIEKAILPHKIWADCLKCPKFPDCDEIAMMLIL
ncbi:MAG: N-acetyltransferase [Desulfobacteraceae bacterium]